MAWIEAKKRADSGTSCTVRWRLGGARDGRPQNETFSAGSDAQNAARADGFKSMVEAAGNRWPEGWIKGHGFIRVRDDEQQQEAASRPLRDVGLDYIDQIVACSPGQRKRYKSQIRLLADTEVRGPAGMYRPFGGLADAVTDGGYQGMADRLGPLDEDQSELPRPADGCIQVRVGAQFREPDSDASNSAALESCRRPA